MLSVFILGYWHFFGRFEIIPPLLSGRLPYGYAVGSSIAAMHKIWSVDCQEIIKIVASRCIS